MKRLSELRQAAGLSVRALGEAAQVSGALITMIEQGKRTPSEVVVAGIAEALEVDADLLALSLGVVPGWIRHMIRDNPERALKSLQDLEKSILTSWGKGRGYIREMGGAV